MTAGQILITGTDKTGARDEMSITFEPMATIEEVAAVLMASFPGAQCRLKSQTLALQDDTVLGSWNDAT